MKKMKFLLTFAALAFSGSIMAQSFSAKDIEVAPGETATVTINYTQGDTPMTGGQVDIYLPEGLEYATNAKGKEIYAAGSDNDDMTVSFKAKSGFYQAVLYDGDLVNGEFFTFDIKAGETEGDFDIKLTNFRFTDVSAKSYKVAGDIIVKVSVKKTSTGINSISLDDPNAEVYTVGGQRVNKSNMKKGVYVVNGKKIAVK